MSNAPTSTAHLAGLNAAQQVERILLVGRIAARLAQHPYGYTDQQALATARTMVTAYGPQQVLVFLGEIPGCSNSGQPAVKYDRCAACEHLPSDYA